MSKDALLRVTQMNAVHFDNEIHKIFSEDLQECLKDVPLVFVARFNSELNLLLKLAVLNYSIVKSGSTFGQKLMGITYNNLNAPRKCLYVIACCFDYVRDKVEMQGRTYKNLDKFLTRLYSFVQVCRFINISIFLRSGVKPQLVERVLGLTQAYSHGNAPRQYDTQYLTRELLWDTFIELLVYFLPLINYHKIKRKLTNLNPFYKKPAISTTGTRSYTVNSKCPHCKEAPILPRHMGCAHIFCYSCLKGNQIADPKYECPACEYSSVDGVCERVTVIT